MLHRSSSSRRALLTRRLLGGAAALAVAAPACGGRVVLDGAATSAGGSGGAGVAVGSVASTGTGTFTCDAAVKPGDTLVYGCIITQGACPPASAATEALGQALNSSAPCPENPQFCTCGQLVVATPCGPDPTVPGCCYIAEMTPTMACE